ncbi:MAG: thiolase domain-containing protein [Deltaproteobacteria bacterium]|nr:thiolase domain-containing protein [Deltaproteobacteria bacterium]
MTAPVYLLGGYQTDFARNWMKEGKGIVEMIQEAVSGALTAARLEAREIEVAHIGNFAAELYCKQGHLGGFLAQIDPSFSGMPTSRHEAACASGGVAMLMASAEIEAGRYDLALVIGIEQMKTVDPAVGGDFLGTAAWYEQEAKGIEFPFPKLFSRLGDEYEKRFGLKEEHLARIAEINFSNARRNPLAQTRSWFTNETLDLASGKYAKPAAGRLRVRDCSQITDGAASIFLASENFTRQYADRRSLKLEQLPRILGWGHRTAPMKFDTKIFESGNSPCVLPHTRQAIVDAFRRAGLADVWRVQGIETHDCFTTSEYMAIDHFGITKPGESWKAIEEGIIDFDGRLPVNASGGLIGGGHPVGATGTRQALDAFKQVTGQAGDYQIDGAQKIATLDIGGSGTTTVAMVVGI